MSKIYLFPGQGSQKTGMGAELFEACQAQVEAADAILGYSLKELCLEDDGARLNQTDYTQPALYCVNAFTYQQAIEKAGAKPDYVAGHSLGEYNALLASGVFDFETGLKLVKERGRLMAEARDGAMAAVVGLSRADIEGLLQQEGLSGIDIANLNAPTQTVVSGPEAEIDKAQEAMEKAGARYVKLKVSAAFHSRYMEAAAKQFLTALEPVQAGAFAIPVVANLTARPYEAENWKETLAAQIHSPVRWVESVQYLLEREEPEFEEIGPGKVLSGLLRKIRT